MKTIYMTGDQWQNRALHSELDRASGDAGFRVGRRSLLTGEDKVVDLATWKVENLVELEEPEAEQVSALEQYGGRKLVRRRHRRPAALDWAELAATLAVAAALIALVVRVLLF